MVVQDGPGASGPISRTTSTTDRSSAAIRFTPTATAADITRFLDVNKATVVQGPKRGGLYEIRLSDKRL